VTDLHLMTVAELSAALHAGAVSSVELARAFLARIERHQPHLNAFITVTAECALEQAAHADECRRAGTGGPLTGIPIAHKDIFCTRGEKTTCGSRMLAGFVSPYDAAVVSPMFGQALASK